MRWLHTGYASGRSRGRTAEKNYFKSTPPPYSWVWMIAPPPHPPLIWRSGVWICHCMSQGIFNNVHYYSNIIFAGTPFYIDKSTVSTKCLAQYTTQWLQLGLDLGTLDSLDSSTVNNTRLIWHDSLTQAQNVNASYDWHPNPVIQVFWIWWWLSRSSWWSTLFLQLVQLLNNSGLSSLSRQPLHFCT